MHQRLAAAHIQNLSLTAISRYAATFVECIVINFIVDRPACRIVAFVHHVWTPAAERIVTNNHLSSVLTVERSLAGRWRLGPCERVVLPIDFFIRACVCTLVADKLMPRRTTVSSIRARCSVCTISASLIAREVGPAVIFKIGMVDNSQCWSGG